MIFEVSVFKLARGCHILVYISRKFDRHSKLGIAYYRYDIIGAEMVKRYELAH